MKSRIEDLESKNPTPETDIDRLVQFAKEWWDAYSPGRDWEAAIEAREKAEPLFEAHPEWRKEQPTHNMPKTLYIDWIWFVRFLEPEWQAGYKKAVEDNEWPARPIN